MKLAIEQRREKRRLRKEQINTWLQPIRKARLLEQEQQRELKIKELETLLSRFGDQCPACIKASRDLVERQLEALKARKMFSSSPAKNAM